MKACSEHGRQLARQWSYDEQIKAEPAQLTQYGSANAKDLGGSMLCTVCQWVYDPAQGEPNQQVAPGTPWADVPNAFLCPECGLGKEVFEIIASSKGEAA